MGLIGTLVAGLSVVLLSGTLAARAQEDGPVLVYDYAISHPTEDAVLAVSPTIGSSVPQAVTVATVEGEAETIYGYFYYQGQPVIVDMSTRSIVRVGD